ncbi:MAG TPA: hypothetical protein VM187_12035 [Niastella sp.]|nr:hypothetical protein [Niastella sp.]
MKSRKPVYILTILFFASFAIIGIQAFISKKLIDKKNGFNRRLLSSALTPQKDITLPVKLTKLIGRQNGILYFQEDKPYEIYSTNQNLDSVQTIKLPIAPDKDLGRNIYMFMKDQLIYIACRNMPGFLIYDLSSGSLDYHTVKNYYNQEAIFSPDEFIVRAKDYKTQSHRFIKFNLQQKDSMREDHFSDRKIIGGFKTAGALYYDTATQQACYTYLYQNGFICMDTSLNLTLKARTIDTVTNREIKVARVGSSLTMKQPPQEINDIGDVFAGRLFLQSMLKADNEYELDFAENSVVDIYNLRTGAYAGSFYIPAYKGQKALHFKVIDNKLYALYGKTIVLYDLGFIEGL